MTSSDSLKLTRETTAKGRTDLLATGAVPFLLTQTFPHHEHKIIAGILHPNN